ncbi:hypothetical protein [Kribbella solani]|uniref:Uncharacterized protein n=1 Tax=Kribbella solani TaxID=236067 RepID=A0A841DSX3_9ACTN|nr:hypothetical protein [Kribbella solani]MBB5979985.1 hypothetical protein [Kribbella solani]
MQIKPFTKPLSATQAQVRTSFSQYITARFRFQSHRWIIDPVYAKAVLPGAPENPMNTDTIGLAGPAVIEILSVTTTTSTKATVAYCVDDRSVRYMGRDGAVDITGPAGDHLVGDVALETSTFLLTTDAAVDGTTSTSPRWLLKDGTLFAGAKECQRMIDSPPPPPPTPRGPTNTP